jgi:hypothetical protein
MNFRSFVLSLNINEILLLLRLWSKHGNNCTTFTHRDSDYLITVKVFYDYYKTLPLDVQENRYLESIINHYKTIYQDFLKNKK